MKRLAVQSKSAPLPGTPVWDPLHMYRRRLDMSGSHVAIDIDSVTRSGYSANHRR